MDKAFVKGINLIEVLSKSEEPRGITSLALELSMTKSNVHRLLTTLLAHGYVSRVASNGTYQLTSKLWELGSAVMSRVKLIDVAKPSMEELFAKTGETVHLSILERFDVLYLDKIESDHAVRAYTRVGGRAPAWCVATGKAMLAYAKTDELDQLTPHLKPTTSATIVDIDVLRATLAEIRQRGFATNFGEWRLDVFGLAAPIFDQDGQVSGAIGISGPELRLSRETLLSFGPDVVEAASQVSRALGYHPKLNRFRA